MIRSALRIFSLALVMTFATAVLDAAVAGTDDRYAAIWAKVGPAEWVARHGMTSEQYQQEFNKFTGQGMRLVVVDGYEADGVVHYAAIWNKASSPPWEARHGLTSAQYQAEFDKLVGQGFRLVWVNGYTAGGQDHYAAIWERSGGPQWVARHGLTSAQYQAEFDKHVGEGFRLALVNGYRVGNQTLYAAIWDKAPSPAWVARHGMTSDGYQQEFSTFTSQGFRLIDVSGY